MRTGPVALKAVDSSSLSFSASCFSAAQMGSHISILGRTPFVTVAAK